MDDEILMPVMILKFGDDNENLMKWIYNLDPGQETFPTNPTLHEGFAAKEDGVEKLCVSEPKGCEGRVLRWFDMGPLPKPFKQAQGYLARLYNGHIEKEEINAKVVYWDTVIGPKNQIRLPSIPAIPHHVYYAIVMVEGTSAASQMVELNMADPDQYDQLLKMVGKPSLFVRGILVRALLDDAFPILPEGELPHVAPAIRLKTSPGGGE